MEKGTILIVGAGPVGLAAALFLHHNGENVRIVEQKTSHNIYSKAFLVNTRTLTLLNSVGADKDIISVAMQMKGMKLFFNN